MTTQFSTHFTETELKELMKLAVKEVLKEQHSLSGNALPEIMNTDEAAEFLGLKKSTLYEKTSCQQIPYSKRGGKLYFLRSELKEWIKRGRIKTYEEWHIEKARNAANLKASQKK